MLAAALYLFIVYLCWGSYLNVVGYRLIHEVTPWQRSHCPACGNELAWYDLIPVVSWFMLRGKCRFCHASISLLYPFIELYTAAMLTLLWFFADPQFFLPYFFFFSALIVVTRTDLETMLISRATTLLLVPLGTLLAAIELLPISAGASLCGALFGYGLLWLVRTVFYRATGKEGLGLGDVELLAMIGAFTGIIGAWFSLFAGSVLGTLFGTAYMLITKDRKIPFGPFLAFGAILYVLITPFIHAFFIP